MSAQKNDGTDTETCHQPVMSYAPVSEAARVRPVCVVGTHCPVVAMSSTRAASPVRSMGQTPHVPRRAESPPVRRVQETLPVVGNAVEAAYDDGNSDSDEDGSDIVDAEALLEGTWTTAAPPRRTNAMEPWPRPTVCIGASILAFAMDPQHDRAYFWLGKERKVLAWGAGSNRWSDFGGGRIRSDVDPAATAAREFVQETAGCVRYFDADSAGLRTRSDDIAASLRKGEYVIKLETTVGKSTDGNIRLFVTYVVQLPWDPRAIMRFQHCRALLSGLHKQLLRVPLDATEKEALTPADSLLRASRARWLLYHPAVRHRVRPVARSLLYGSGAGDDAVTERAPVVESVNLDYMEKECLDLWSVPQLRRALHYDGILSNRDGSVESLRPSFVTVLTEAFDELAARFPIHFKEAPGCAYPAVTF